MDSQSSQAPVNCPRIHHGNRAGPIKGPRIISYNLREEERPGGLKARYKIKVETGRKARDTGARQAAAIRELLIWAHQHPTST
jgi:hypothetical protein